MHERGRGLRVLAGRPGPRGPGSSTASVTPTRVTAGQGVTFPLSPVSIENVGTQTAGAHRYGIYLSTATSASESALPRNADGTIKENPNGPGVITRLVQFGDLAEVPASGSESVGSQVIPIPADIPLLNPDGTGTYYLYLYVDDRRRVNELNEDNNIVQGGPIIVDPAGYRMLGLFTPCTGLTCKKKAGTSIPLAFQLTMDGVTAVDSQSTPRAFGFTPRSAAVVPNESSRRMAPATFSSRIRRTRPRERACGSTSRSLELDRPSPGSTTSRERTPPPARICRPGATPSCSRCLRQAKRLVRCCVRWRHSASR